MNTVIKGSKPGPTTPSFSPNPSSLLEIVSVPPSKGPSEDHKPSNYKLYNSLPEQHEKSETETPIPSISGCAAYTIDRGYPEGGLRAWLVVFGSFCGMVGSFGFMNTSTHYLF